MSLVRVKRKGFSRMKGIGEKDLEHLFITSSSSHFFNKTDFEQYLFEDKKKLSSNCDEIVNRNFRDDGRTKLTTCQIVNLETKASQSRQL